MEGTSPQNSGTDGEPIQENRTKSRPVRVLKTHRTVNPKSKKQMTTQQLTVLEMTKFLFSQ